MEIDKLWEIFRFKRNKLLAETDKTQLPDFPIDTTMRRLYKEYRQYLRDCPKLFNDSMIATAKIKTFEQWREWKRRASDY